MRLVLTYTTETSKQNRPVPHVIVMPTVSAPKIGHVTSNLHAGCIKTCIDVA